MTRCTVAAALIAMGSLLGGAASAQPLSSEQIAAALRGGGYVLVMRHARSPRTPPDAASAEPRNVDLERQLDDDGRKAATAMGDALRKLAIPIGEVLASPTFRGMQTAWHLALGEPQPVVDLGDGGAGMQADSEGKRSSWLREHASAAPREGGNTIMITHAPNLNGAFGAEAANMSDGEALIVRPGGSAPVVVGRVRIDEWPALAGVAAN